MGATSVAGVQLIQAWRAPDPALIARVDLLEKRTTANEESHKRLSTDFTVLREDAKKWGNYVDASLCALGVKPPTYPCPEVLFLPEPLARPRKKGTEPKPIQPSIEGLKPLGGT
jgi:hypothetical protein